MVCLCALPMLSGCYVSGNVIGANSYIVSSVLDYLTIEDGGPSGTSISYASVVDPLNNNVYVASASSAALDGQTQHGTYDLVITKYNSSGVRQWTVQDGTASATIYPTSMTIDSSSNIYVVGYLNGVLDGQTQHALFGYDFFVTKYNSSGVRQWTVQDGGTALIYSVAYGVAVDTSSNVYVTGTTTGAIDGQTKKGNYDLFYTKYNTSGTRQFTIQDGIASGQSYGASIIIDSTNTYAYITGYTTKGIDTQTQHGNWDMLITKYNLTGTRQWTIQDGLVSGSSYGTGIKLDSSGSLYVLGQTTVAMDGQTEHGAQDFFLTKYNTSGVLQWTVQDGPPSTGKVTPWSMAIDSSNNFYLTGYTDTAMDGQTQYGTSDMVLTKYNSSGVRQWTEQDGASGATVYSQGVAVDSLGHVYAVGGTMGALDGQTLHGTFDTFITQRNTSGL